MAIYSGDIDLFFRKDNIEGYRTPYNNVVRMTRHGVAYLGERVGVEEMDVAEVRLERAVHLLEKSGGKLLKQSREKSAGKWFKYILRKVLACDRSGFCENRSIHQGLLTSEGRDLLAGFDFNSQSRPGKWLNAMQVDFTNGSLCLSDFSASLLLSKAVPAYQLKLRFLLSRVDFSLGEFMTFMSEELTFTAADPVQDMELKIGQCPDGDGVLFAYLWVGFERDDAVAVPELLWHVDDVFRLVDLSS